MQIKRFAAPQKCLIFKFHDVQTGRGGWKYSGLPARPENYCESKQTYLRYSLDKAFHLPEFQRKLFFTRNWVGGFKGENLVQRLPLTRALLEGFFLQFKPAAWWTSINRYHGFHSLAKRRFFPCFSSTRKNMSAFEPFCYFAILLQDLTPLHVKITRSTNFLSYNYILSFLNARSQLVWVLASSGFYKITWRTISRSAGSKIHFRIEQPPFRGNLCPLSVCYLSFPWIYAPRQFVHGSRVFIQLKK